jgi:uncharacterized short protein YbdD (DUF466 family)
MLDRRNARNLRNEPTHSEMRFSLFRSFGSLVRRVAGMPDYERHIQHLRECHPELSLPTERQFFEDFVRARYGDGPTRCC